MTAGLTDQPIAGTKLALAPAALVGLLGAALLAGCMLGAAITYALGSVGSNSPIAQVAATDSSFESPALIQTRAGERESVALAITTHVRDHIGLTELLFPVPQAAPHVRDHIGLTERLFPVPQAAPHVRDHIGLTERLFK